MLSFFHHYNSISVALFIIERVKAVIFCFLCLLVIFMFRFDYQQMANDHAIMWGERKVKEKKAFHKKELWGVVAVK